MTDASIIITSYNYARFLRQAIDSALAQTHRQTEVIVVDDGSTDDSRAIIESYSNRIKPILKDNAGQASALNAGLGSARGELLVFLDSDDALEPDAIAQALELMQPGISKVHWPLREMNVWGNRGSKLVPAVELPRGELRSAVLRHGPRSDWYLWPPTSGNAWSRGFLQRVMPMPESSYRTCPDLYLCALAALYGQIAASRRPLGLWRVHGENSTWRQPFTSRVKHYAMLWASCCEDLERHARRLGFTPDPHTWLAESWWHRLERATRQLIAVIPQRQSFILIDDDQWACRDLDGRAAVPLISRNGESRGAPADDEQAVRELEVHCSRGVRFVVFTWQTFWWLDHYTGLAGYLQSRFRRAVEDENLVVFEA